MKKTLKDLALCSEDNFKKAVELTEKDLGIELPAFSGIKSEKWVQLFICWEQAYEWDGIDGLLFHVFHKIHWEVYPDCDYTKEQREILNLVEAEIRSNPMVRAMWVNVDFIADILDAIEVTDGAFVKNGPRYLSGAHKIYLNSRTNCFFGKGIKYEYSWVDGYEKVIKKLLPEAETWPEGAWTDEKEIFKGMAMKYNIIFDKQDPAYVGDSYEAFIRLMVFKAQRKRMLFVVGATMLEKGSSEMLRLIWPTVKKSTFVNLLQDMVEYAKCYKGSKNEVLNSWVYKQVEGWNNSGCLKGTTNKKARSAIFELHTACI